MRKEFWNRLDQLDRGQRTALKREAGTMLSQAKGKAVRVFYQCLPCSLEPWKEERYFAAACIHCLWEPGDSSRLPLEQIFYRLGRDAELSESLSHRIESVLDLSWSEDGYLLTKLMRLIHLIRSKGYAVDCDALLWDLLDWNGEQQSVQLRWARALYQKPDLEREEN